MPDLVIRAEGLSKIYPLATSTRRRLLYVLGFDRSGDRAVATKAAVAALDLEIRRGEKVGIVGRNGSGKSTLLGMISGTIEPSEGRLVVDGTIHALLQLGAGFNDDLTGRDNAYSYLAMQGVSGRDADRRVGEIADFAEIGIYFDQPVKTYSSGMRLRLMFAAATSVSPDILILDEVLSVGDAYFIGKSFDRMRQLCAGDGTTLLVVSHAVNMLPELCDRIVWIDNGAVRMDGDPVTVARAYDNFVRAEEENRLRKLQAANPVRQLATLLGEPPDADAAAAQSAGGTPFGIVGEFRMPDGQPPRNRLVIQRLELLRDGAPLADIRVGADRDAGDAILLTGEDEGNWGHWDVAAAGRPFASFGSPFHKLPFVITAKTLPASIDAAGLEARLTCSSGGAGDVDLLLHRETPPGRWRARFALNGAAAGETVTAPLLPLAAGELVDDAPPSSATSGRYGTRRIEFLDVEFLGEGDRPRLVYSIGAPLRVRMRYRINDPGLDENAEIVLAFQKDGLQVTNRFFLDEYRFAAGERREGEIFLDASPLLLAQGEYVVSVALHAAGHATRKLPREHVSVARTVYDMYYRYFHLTVFEPYHTTLLNDVIFQHPATWIVDSQKFQTTVVTD